MAGTDVSLKPSLGQERIHTIDVLRGVAVLGILILNIRTFALDAAAYWNPAIEGGGVFSVWDTWSFWIVQLLGDQKFMSIFSMLFGAGIVLMAARIADRGRRPGPVHYRRMVWLLVIGLVHAYLIWWGDILVAYAICGMLIYPLWRLAARWQLVAGLLLLGVGGLIWAGFGASLPYWPPEDKAALHAQMVAPSVEALADYSGMMLGSWADQMAHRGPEALGMQLFILPVWGIWRAGGLMLLGMALFKWGIFSAQRSNGFYAGMIMLGGVCGIALSNWTLQLNEAIEWSTLDIMFLNAVPAYFGSVLTSLAWVGLVMVLSRSATGLISRALAATGRMALTNYIAQSLLCSVLFYGWGVGLYGQLGYFDQWFVIVALWLLAMIWSLWWLSNFNYGPLEWVWRSLVQWRSQPMLREQFT